MTVDLSYLKSLVGDDPEVLREMLGIFCEDVPKYLANFQAAEESGDWESLARVAHSLKSSLGFTGRMDMVDMAELLQHQKTPTTDPQVLATIAKFKVEADGIVKEFQNILATGNF